MTLRRLWLGLFVLVLAGHSQSTLATAPAEDSNDLAQYYGFKPLEVYKLARRSANMVAGDFNHDGLTDLILADNSHSRLDLLQQRRKPDDKKPVAKLDINAFALDWRFEHRKISVNRPIAAIAIGDFNGDDRTDIVYFAVPDQLIIRLQPKTGDWTEKVTFRLPDVVPASWIVATGDINGDKRDDIAVLGKTVTYLIHQQADGKLATPQRLLNTSEKLALIQFTDLDGDGRTDICYTASDNNDRVLCARLQTSDGRVGPELRCELNRPRSVTLANIDGRPGHEILTIDVQTNRLKVLKLKRSQLESGKIASRLIQFGFGPQGSGRDSDLAVGDLDGDGLTDVVVSDPESARMIVFRQHKGRGLGLGESFPGLLGTEQLRIGHLGGKLLSVVSLSSKEKAIGISQLRADRLTFPQTLPLKGEPAAFDLVNVTGDDRLEIVYISKERVGRVTKYHLSALVKTDQGKWKPLRFGDKENVTLNLRGAPKSMIHLDANNDGRMEFLVFLGLDRPPHLFSTSKDGQIVEIISGGGIQLGEVSPGAVTIGQLGKRPAILVAQERFARNIVLDTNNQWQVIDQYNATESKARIEGVAAINLDGKAGNEIVLVDSGVKKLRILRLDGNVYRPWSEVDIGQFPFKSTHVVDLNGDGKEDLLLFGQRKFGVLFADQSDLDLQEVASFETKLKKTFFSDVVVGDLNNDNHIDFVLKDTRSHAVEILDFQPATEGPKATAAILRHALSFTLYEEKNFAAALGGGTEPRESIIVDVTNDGLPDLILLTHDRVLVYPQDDGK